MSKQVLAFILKLLILILAQVVIFNNLILFNVAVPMVFIYAIISMPITWSTNVAMTIGFLLGLTIDIFTDTQGVNALACTILCFVRKPIFHLYMQHDEDLSGMKPSLRSMGLAEYLKYTFTMILAYCSMVFMIDAFAVFNPVKLLLQIVCSTIFTFIIIYALDTIFTRQHEKRL